MVAADRVVTGTDNPLQELHEAVRAIRVQSDRFPAIVADATNPLNERITELVGRVDQMALAARRIQVAGPGAGDLSDEQRERRAAFATILRTRVADRAIIPANVRALVEDGTGQILVPEELEAGVIRALPALTILRGLCSQITIGRDRIRRRTLTEVAVGWGKLETGADLVNTDLTPDSAYQYVENHNGETSIGSDELEDTDLDLATIIADSFGRAFAESEDSGFVIGAGHGSGQPEGILDGSTITRVDTAAVNAVSVEDILGVVYAVDPRYRRNGSYIMHSDTERRLMVLRDSSGGAGTGQFLWQPSVQLGTPNMLRGYPVYNQSDFDRVPSDSSAQDVVAFGDWRSCYRIVDRRGMVLKRLEDSVFVREQLVGFFATRRVGGGVIRAEAARILRTKTA